MIKCVVFQTLIATSGLFLLTGCGSTKSSSVANGILNRTWSINQTSPTEKYYCINMISYTTSHSISGTASYHYRPVGTDVGNEGLLAVAATPKPIRHAQYDVTDATGTILQCGETDESGNFSFNIPKNNNALSLNIYSRSNNAFNRASIFIAPETNELHKLQYFFTANSNKSGLNVIAEAKNTLIGGAFNILDQIHESFDSLNLNTNPREGIAPIDIPKVDIYWEKGFNPGIYVGVNSGLSFFSKPQAKLFILGGLNGDTNFADTDHFDNSIILHEYFHFLEMAISVSHSPGGAHNGNQILDPRLAWSEGAAQFYQSFVTGIPSVLDTRGNSDGSTGFYLKLSLENETTDLPIEPGEGEFREFGVARLLWDIHDTEDGEAAPEGFDTLNGYFSNFWRAFSSDGTSADFKHSKSHFASLGLLLEIIDFISPIQGNANWEALLTHSLITYPTVPANSFRAEYSQVLVPTASDSFSFTGPFYRPGAVLTNNHPVASLDYYSIDIPANTTQPFSFTSYTTNHATNQDGALQMYILPNNYVSLMDFIHGPIAAGAPVDLTGGADGTTYMIVIAISRLPQKAVSGVETTITYQFPGFGKGGF